MERQYLWMHGQDSYIETIGGLKLKMTGGLQLKGIYPFEVFIVFFYPSPLIFTHLLSHIL